MMQLLLDTHALLWFLWDDRHLSSGAKASIADTGNDVYVSIASCWEIAIKCHLGKLILGEASHSFLNRELPNNKFKLLPISLSHATEVETLPMHHRDPFDRLLIAQAKLDGLTLVSRDQAFQAYAIQRLW